MGFFDKFFGKNKSQKNQNLKQPVLVEEKESIQVDFHVSTLIVDTLPFELMLNMVLLDKSVRTNFTWVWFITLQAFETDSQGLPVTEEKEKLTKIMQLVIQNIIKTSNILIVGTTTYKGIYEIMFYGMEADTKEIGGTIAGLPEFVEDKKGRFLNYTGNKDENWEKVKEYYELSTTNG